MKGDKRSPELVDAYKKMMLIKDEKTNTRSNRMNGGWGQRMGLSELYPPYILSLGRMAITSFPQCTQKFRFSRRAALPPHSLPFMLFDVFFPSLSLSRFTSNKLFGKGEAEKNNANKITQYFRLSSKHSLFGGEHGKFLMTFRKTFVFTPLAATTADELKKTFSSNVTCKAKSIFCTISSFFIPFSRGNLFIFFFAQYE